MIEIIDIVLDVRPTRKWKHTIQEVVNGFKGGTTYQFELENS